jgi:drug/metabolite transporter (DMT)-like permease
VSRVPSGIPSPWRVIAAFIAVYTIWGATYLGIRFAIETIPPFLMAGSRFMIAGAMLYAWMRLRGVPAPTRMQWRATTIIGALLLLGGNGVLAWAEQLVPSGLAALIISMVPVWMVLLDWRRGGARPTMGISLGLVLGVVGIVLLVGPTNFAGGNQLNTLGVIVLLFASLSWATGSLYARRASVPAVPLLATSMEMLTGGGLLLLAGLVTGEGGQLRLDHLSLRSAIAFGYLVFFGSLVGFSAYTWLLRVSTPARVSTYAYVNPVVAVFLGWALAGEALTPQTVLAAAVIITAVVVITTSQSKKSASQPASALPSVAPTE